MNKIHLVALCFVSSMYATQGSVAKMKHNVFSSEKTKIIGLGVGASLASNLIQSHISDEIKGESHVMVNVVNNILPLPSSLHGVKFGLIATVCARLGDWPKLKAEDLVMPTAVTVGATLGLAAVQGVIGWALSSSSPYGSVRNGAVRDGVRYADSMAFSAFQLPALTFYALILQKRYHLALAKKRQAPEQISSKL